MASGPAQTLAPAPQATPSRDPTRAGPQQRPYRAVLLPNQPPGAHAGAAPPPDDPSSDAHGAVPATDARSAAASSRAAPYPASFSRRPVTAPPGAPPVSRPEPRCRGPPLPVPTDPSAEAHRAMPPTKSQHPS